MNAFDFIGTVFGLLLLTISIVGTLWYALYGSPYGGINDDYFRGKKIPTKDTIDALNEPTDKLPRFKTPEDLFEECENEIPKEVRPTLKEKEMFPSAVPHFKLDGMVKHWDLTIIDLEGTKHSIVLTDEAFKQLCMDLSKNEEEL